MLNQTCVIVGASHGGVNCAFALRKEGWKGEIILIDADPHLPYHRPPLSKSFLTSDKGIEAYALKPEASYDKEEIRLLLGKKVTGINKGVKELQLSDGTTVTYDILVLSTGASPLIPPIKGIRDFPNIFALRTAQDVNQIKSCFENLKQKRVIIIGGGYIGLEIASSLIQLGAEVTLLERESRLLARVTSPEVSQFFEEYHTAKGVDVKASKEVEEIKQKADMLEIKCKDQSLFTSEMIIYGVGVRVNTELAIQANLAIENGIIVDEKCQTSESNIYAIGDNTFHSNPYYKRQMRLESVQNAVDQAKIVAKAICAHSEVSYNAIPWFWSDQFDLKLQMVGLIDGYNEVIVRTDPVEINKRSFWFFKDEVLLAVQAVNDAKAYVYGTKLIKEKAILNKEVLANSSEVLDMKRLVVA